VTRNVITRAPQAVSFVFPGKFLPLLLSQAANGLCQTAWELIRGILIITPTGILYGRTSVIRSPIIRAPRTSTTARTRTTANIAIIKRTTAK